jgi:hypothetical protein
VDSPYDPNNTTVIIETRDLDTDERGRTSLEVKVPGDKAEQRAMLAAAVADRFPDARFRSFADGAATFLDRQHLIVACFAKTNGRPAKRVKQQSATPQETLFAA